MSIYAELTAKGFDAANKFQQNLFRGVLLTILLVALMLLVGGLYFHAHYKIVPRCETKECMVERATIR